MTKHKSKGGGWSTGPQMISPGNLAFNQYDGPGKDCAGVAVRPGYIDMYSKGGMPGLSGGRRSRKYGGTRLMAASNNLSDVINTPDSRVYPSHGVSAPGVPTHSATVQKGGRYGSFPELGALNPSNGVGLASYAPIGRVGCETGSINSLNQQAMHIATTAPASPPYMKHMGGKHSNRHSNRRNRHRGGANFPVVHAGAADSMRYYAPTAGYTNDFEAFPAGGAVPGLTLQTPYDARGSNMACNKTGGSRRNVRGGMNLADNAEAFTPVQMNQLVNRSDFDGSQAGLPVKYGGRRVRRMKKKRTQRKHKKHYRKSHKSF
jgi:hypothetical protein